jgi:hypothetical protein
VDDADGVESVDWAPFFPTEVDTGAEDVEATASGPEMGVAVAEGGGSTRDLDAAARGTTLMRRSRWFETWCGGEARVEREREVRKRRVAVVRVVLIVAGEEVSKERLSERYPAWWRDAVETERWVGPA